MLVGVCLPAESARDTAGASLLKGITQQGFLRRASTRTMTAIAI